MATTASKADIMLARCSAPPVCSAAAALPDALELCDAELGPLEDWARAVSVPVWLALALVTDADADSSSSRAVAVLVGSAETPVIVWTFPLEAVYNPEMAFPFPPTSS